jgi:DNA-binding XRE family transcriptional regulator
MIAEIKSLSFRDKAFMVALATIGERIKELPRDDQVDLRELTKEYLSNDEEDARESAAVAIMEILDQTPATVVEMEALQGTGAADEWALAVGRRIRDLRMAAKLTQEQLAERSGLTQSHVCRLELGQHAPNALTIERIARALGVPVSRIDGV